MTDQTENSPEVEKTDQTENPLEVEATGLRLAERAYLFYYFHIAFGSDPSAEWLGVISSEDSQGVFKDCIGASTLFEALREEAKDPAFIENLKSSYTRLFLVPGEQRVSPWESTYIGKEIMIFQESTLDVRERYAAYGFEAVSFKHFPEDHLAMMLDFLGHLSALAYKAYADGDDAAYTRIEENQDDFIAVHLKPWLPAFCDELREKDTQGIFSRLADLLQAWLNTPPGLTNARA